MNILEEILVYKRIEIAKRKELYPLKLLEQSKFFSSPTVSLRHYLTRPGSSGIIAEFKKRSPSKGEINKYAAVDQVSVGYMQAGAAALSILTDEKYFGGSLADLTVARKLNFCPILRKDFVLDEYQIVEARSAGADVVLLIAAALEPERLKNLARCAKSLQLEVLLEVTTGEQVTKFLCEDIDIVGVNNRNLKNFSVDLNCSIELAKQIPAVFLKISESGIDTPDKILKLREHGYCGFLIGELFMRNSKPEQACARFIEGLS